MCLQSQVKPQGDCPQTALGESSVAGEHVTTTYNRSKQMQIIQQDDINICQTASIMISVRLAVHGITGNLTATGTAGHT